MSDLKNCPFCGTRAVSSVFSIDVYNWYEEKVCCENCSCIISHPQAIQIWNTRPAEDAKDREIERLKEDNQVYRDMLNSLLNEEVYHLDNVTMTNIKYELDNRGKDTNVPANAPDTGKMEEN